MLASRTSPCYLIALLLSHPKTRWSIQIQQLYMHWSWMSSWAKRKQPVQYKACVQERRCWDTPFLSIPSPCDAIPSLLFASVFFLPRMSSYQPVLSILLAHGIYGFLDHQIKLPSPVFFFSSFLCFFSSEDISFHLVLLYIFTEVLLKGVYIFTVS